LAQWWQQLRTTMAFMGGGGGGGGYCELQVPTDKVKFLVGKARATAKAIEAEYGVKLHIPRPEQQQPGGVTTVGLEAATAEGGAAAQACVAGQYPSAAPQRNHLAAASGR